MPAFRFSRQQQAQATFLGQGNLRNQARGSWDNAIEYGRTFVQGEHDPSFALFKQIDNCLGTGLTTNFLVMAKGQQNCPFWLCALGQQAFNAFERRRLKTVMPPALIVVMSTARDNVKISITHCVHQPVYVINAP